MSDAPNTKALPSPAAVLIADVVWRRVPSTWASTLGGEKMPVLTNTSLQVREVIDFYEGRPWG